MPKVLTRYILRELVLSFSLAILVLTLTFLLGRSMTIARLVLEYGLGIGFAISFVAYILPSFLIYTLPASLLVAVLTTFTRMSFDNEIIAMKSSGISLWKIARAVFLFALLVYAVTTVVHLYLYPWGNNNLRRLAYELTTKKTTKALKEKKFYNRFKDMVLYVDHIPAGKPKLMGVFLMEREPDGAHLVVVAKEGRFLHIEEEMKLLFELKDGSIHRATAEGGYNMARFSTYTIELELKEAIIKRERKGKEFYPWELFETIQKKREKGEPTVKLEIEFHRMFSLPASVFIFALIGLPLGIQRVRSARFTGFGISIGVLVVYYLLVKVFEAGALTGKIPPAVALWGANVVLGGLGMWAFVRAAKERPVGVVPAIEGAIFGLWERISKLVRI